VGLVLLLNVAELLSFVVLFYHVYHHDNSVAISILNPKVIKARNTQNAISLVGQLSTWILETAYVLLLLNFAYLFSISTSRELASFIKLSEFTVIPFVQILCSPPLRKFVMKYN
jgi:hypothetical protein